MTSKLFTVHTTADLVGALNAARGGDTIELAGGQWGRVELGTKSGAKLVFDEEVTIRSADPGNKAVISDFLLRGAQNLTFEDIVFDYTFSDGDTWKTETFVFDASTELTIRNCLFDGDIGFGDDSMPGTDGYAMAHGPRIHASSDVLFEDNEITGFARGFKLHNSTDVTVRGNEFHHQRMDHMVMSELTRVLIEDNTFRDHNIAPDSNDHRDMLQLWSSTSANGITTSDLTINGNRFLLNESDWNSQTMFFNNKAVDNFGAGLEMYYRNFTITNNVIVNGQKHGLKLGSIDGVYVANNTMVRDSVLDGDTSNETPMIEVAPNSRNVTIEKNVTYRINGHEGQADWRVADNVLAQDDDPRLANHYSDLFINPGEGTRSDIANLQTLPGSIIEQLGAGAPQLAYDPTPETLTALFRPVLAADNWAAYDFDAGYTAGPDGPLGAAAAYRWDFGDGTTGTGAAPRHAYAAPGDYVVTLTVTAQDGSVDTVTSKIAVGTPELLAFDGGAAGLSLPGSGGSAGAALLAEDAEEGLVLDFDGAATRLEIVDEALAPVVGADEVRLDLRLKGGDWSTDAGELLRVHNGFLVAVEADGRVKVRIEPEGQPAVVLVSDTALPEGRWSDLTLHADARAGTAVLAIDGVEAGRAALTGGLRGDLEASVNLGSAWGGTGFTGQIAALQLSADKGMYAYAGSDPGDEVALAESETVYDLAAALAYGDGLVFKGDAAAADGDSLVFDGAGDSVVLSGIPEDLFGQGVVHIDFSYQREVADGSYARLVWNHNRLGIEAMDDGLGLRLRTADGTMKRFVIEDLGLNDTDLHRVQLWVDETADTVALAVDDVIVFTHSGTDIDITDTDLLKQWDWMVGGAWAGWFNGTISDLSIQIAETSQEAESLSDYDALMLPFESDPFQLSLDPLLAA